MPTEHPPGPLAPVEHPRQLIVLLGDQLDRNSAALRDANPREDAILMAEVADEATHVPSHRQRTVLFLSAMRHRAAELARAGWRGRYVGLDDPDNTNTLSGEVARASLELQPTRLRVVQPGEHRVFAQIDEWRSRTGLPVDVLPDEHFLTDLGDFSSWRAQRRTPVMEHFYRRERRRAGVLLTGDGKPVGGSWNYDAANRQSFRKAPRLEAPLRFKPDEITRAVMRSVERRFPTAPGKMDSFGWAVTRRQALRALADFVDHRLSSFGPFQDAMLVDEPFLYHSLLSPALNLKLIDPKETVERVLGAFESGKAPLQSVEGFVRQVMGWREFMRGIYWTEGPDYGHRNSLNQNGKLPDFYWSGRTDMECLRQSVTQVIEHGYGHHIQRLMVTGNFALTAGIDPRALADWYLGMFVDGVDWVTLPNTVGMVMYADGGVVGTKPYAASGRYIQKMSNYCSGCRFDPGKRSGEDACPLTVFYWDFLIRNEARFQANTRIRLQLKHVERMSRDERLTISKDATRIRTLMGIGEID